MPKDCHDVTVFRVLNCFDMLYECVNASWMMTAEILFASICKALANCRMFWFVSFPVIDREVDLKLRSPS